MKKQWNFLNEYMESKHKTLSKTKPKKEIYAVGESYTIKIPNKDIWVRKDEIYLGELTKEQAITLVTFGVGNNIYKKV